MRWIIAALLILVVAPAAAEGFLANKPQALKILTLGTDDAGYQVSEKEYRMETGKAYELKIVASGRKPYALRGDAFFQNVWLRKVEVDDVEIKATGLYEIEMEQEGEATLVFVPIRPGEYTLGAKGLEERGTVVKMIVR